jgi:Na+-transporting methylmalonyl-CoA/oxaloacetate decarboxylase gamma subunit
MNWFANKGQVVQIATGLAQFTLSLVVLIFGLRSARPVMSSGNYFSAGAILFYVLVILVFVSTGISIWFSLRRKREQTPIPAQLTKVESPSSVSTPLRDEANKAKIAVIFHAHGKHASENIQKIVNELYEQLNRSESKEKLAIVEIAHRSLSIPCAFTYNTLRRALEEKKDSFPMLRRDLEDFFLAYFRLVLCVQTIDGLLERSVPPDKTRILWQNDHKLFLDDLRELFAEEDFSTSRIRMKEGQHGIFEEVQGEVTNYGH